MCINKIQTVVICAIFYIITTNFILTFYFKSLKSHLSNALSALSTITFEENVSEYGRGHSFSFCGPKVIRPKFIKVPVETVKITRFPTWTHIASCVFVQVTAVDQEDGLTATAQLNITVLDYNDNTPQFPSIPDPLQIPEGDYTEENPREIFRIVATDADLGLNGEVTVSLASPHTLFRFREVRGKTMEIYISTFSVSVPKL